MIVLIICSVVTSETLTRSFAAAKRGIVDAPVFAEEFAAAAARDAGGGARADVKDGGRRTTSAAGAAEDEECAAIVSPSEPPGSGVRRHACGIALTGGEWSLVALICVVKAREIFVSSRAHPARVRAPSRAAEDGHEDLCSPALWSSLSRVRSHTHAARRLIGQHLHPPVPARSPHPRCAPPRASRRVFRIKRLTRSKRCSSWSFRRLG